MDLLAMLKTVENVQALLENQMNSNYVPISVQAAHHCGKLLNTDSPREAWLAYGICLWMATMYTGTLINYRLSLAMKTMFGPEGWNDEQLTSWARDLANNSKLEGSDIQLLLRQAGG